MNGTMWSKPQRTSWTLCHQNPAGVGYPWTTERRGDWKQLFHQLITILEELLVKQYGHDFEPEILREDLKFWEILSGSTDLSGGHSRLRLPFRDNVTMVLNKGPCFWKGNWVKMPHLKRNMFTTSVVQECNGTLTLLLQHINSVLQQNVDDKGLQTRLYKVKAIITFLSL